ncbi:MAG: hypothetical protein PVJ43_12385 [Gemmatimonadales bacterium]|jgi:hypothetical protein
MMRSNRLTDRPWAVFLLLLLGAVSSCGDDINTEYPRPSEPRELSLYDLVSGPIDRPSAVNVVSGRALGVPSAVRIDVTERWDLVFALVDGSPAWLPRGFFEALEVSSGILATTADFEQIIEAPEDKELYEDEQPVPMTEGTTYIIRSRSDPDLSLPCRIYAKVLVESIQADPARADLSIIWNPNCDGRNLVPSEPQ